MKLLLLLWGLIGLVSCIYYFIGVNKSYKGIMLVDLFSIIFIFLLGPICPTIWYVRKKIRTKGVPIVKKLNGSKI